MRTEDIIIRLFRRVDDKLAKVNKRSNAHLYPSEIVTIGILFTLKGVHYRACYRWLKGDIAGRLSGSRSAALLVMIIYTLSPLSLIYRREILLITRSSL